MEPQYIPRELVSLFSEVPYRWISIAAILNRREQISSVIFEPPYRIAWRAALESQQMTIPLACSGLERLSYRSRGSIIARSSQVKQEEMAPAPTTRW
ncbi:hypothetical protein TNCV_3438561 [Trichonephila clavipes]|nr:hypothetical protein TNCV_3438561 [Trichonephila clavipes]